MTKRTIVTREEHLHELVPNWYRKDFAYDVETSGLDYINDRLLGLALTFEDGDSYYLTVAHTDPYEETVTKTRTIQVIDGYEDYEHITPTGRVKIKQRPLYKDVEEEYEAVELRTPAREYLSPDFIARLLRPLFAQTDVTMIAHNAKFDLHFLAAIGIKVMGRLADTMLAAQLIDENREVGLKSLATLVGMQLTPYSELVSIPGFKKHEILGVPFEIAADYAMMDTEATFMLWERFSVELAEEGVDRAFTNIWMPMLVVLQQMEARGIALDLEKVRQVREQYQAQKDEHDWQIWEEGMKFVLARYPDKVAREAIPATSSLLRMATETELATALEDETGDQWVLLDGGRLTCPLIQPNGSTRSKPRVFDFNPGSNDHLAMLVYDKHGLSLPRDLKPAKSADRSVDKNTLKIMKDLYEDDIPPLINHVLERRTADKFIGTYLDKFIDLADGTDHDCIRTNFNQAVTDTGRLSSSQPINLTL